MTESASATATLRDDFSVDDRGYIHGGFDTPIFLQAKKNHNAMLTQKRHKIGKSSEYGKTKKGESDPIFMTDKKES